VSDNHISVQRGIIDSATLKHALVVTMFHVKQPLSPVADRRPGMDFAFHVKHFQSKGSGTQSAAPHGTIDVY
jgi:hypothetical protein